MTSSRPTLVQAPSAEDPALTAQVAGGLTAALKQGGGAVILRLRPEHLGTVTIDITMKGDAVSASIEADSQSARDLLSHSLPLLRESLAARGLRIERMEITQPAEPAQQSPSGSETRLPPEDRTSHGHEPAEQRRDTQGQYQGGAESHADRRHAGSGGRTDASDAGELGGEQDAAAEPPAFGSLSAMPVSFANGSTSLRLDAVA